MSESVKRIAMEYVSTTGELEHVQWYLSFAQQLNDMFVCAREHTDESCRKAVSHIDAMLKSLSHFSTTDIIDDAYPFISETFYKLHSNGLPSRKPPHIPFSEVISIAIMQLSLARDYAKFLLDPHDLLELLRLLPALSLQPLSPSLRSVLCSCFHSVYGGWLQTTQSLLRSAQLPFNANDAIKMSERLEMAGSVGMAGN